MRMLLLLAGAALTAGCVMQDTAIADQGEGHAQLASALSGYEQSGPPQDCVNLRDLQGNRSAGEYAIIFQGSGGRLWVNRPAAGCPDLRNHRALRTSTPTGRLCRGEIAAVFDPAAGIEYGGCSLGDFTPYRRVRG